MASVDSHCLYSTDFSTQTSTKKEAPEHIVWSLSSQSMLDVILKNVNEPSENDFHPICDNSLRILTHNVSWQSSNLPPLENCFIALQEYRKVLMSNRVLHHSQLPNPIFNGTPRDNIASQIALALSMQYDIIGLQEDRYEELDGIDTITKYRNHRLSANQNKNENVTPWTIYTSHPLIRPFLKGVNPLIDSVDKIQRYAFIPSAPNSFTCLTTIYNTDKMMPVSYYSQEFVENMGKYFQVTVFEAKNFNFRDDISICTSDTISQKYHIMFINLQALHTPECDSMNDFTMEKLNSFFTTEKMSEYLFDNENHNQSGIKLEDIDAIVVAGDFCRGVEDATSLSTEHNEYLVGPCNESDSEDEFIDARDSNHKTPFYVCGNMMSHLERNVEKRPKTWHGWDSQDTNSIDYKKPTFLPFDKESEYPHYGPDMILYWSKGNQNLNTELGTVTNGDAGSEHIGLWGSIDNLGY